MSVEDILSEITLSNFVKKFADYEQGSDGRYSELEESESLPNLPVLKIVEGLRFRYYIDDSLLELESTSPPINVKIYLISEGVQPIVNGKEISAEEFDEIKDKSLLSLINQASVKKSVPN